jgi:hypothetical protein
MAFKQKNNPFKKKSVDLSKNTPEENKKLMQEYRRKNMRRTRPMKGGGIKTKHLGYDPEGAIIKGVKQLKGLFK